MSEKIVNLSKFTPKGSLGKLFKKARVLNRLNKQLSEHLPTQFASLSLCAVENNVATFASDNQAIVYRAQKQNDVLLDAVKQVEALAQIEKVVTKINLATTLE